MTGDHNLLFKILVSLGMKKIIASHAHTQDLGTGDVFKISYKHLHLFYMGVHPILGILPQNRNF